MGNFLEINDGCLTRIRRGGSSGGGGGRRCHLDEMGSKQANSTELLKLVVFFASSFVANNEEYIQKNGGKDGEYAILRHEWQTEKSVIGCTRFKQV